MRRRPLFPFACSARIGARARNIRAGRDLRGEPVVRQIREQRADRAHRLVRFGEAHRDARRDVAARVAADVDAQRVVWRQPMVRAHVARLPARPGGEPAYAEMRDRLRVEPPGAGEAVLQAS